MKKLFTFIFSLFVATNVRSYDFKSGNLYYNITDEEAKTVEVTYEVYGGSDNYRDLSGELYIPTSVNYNGSDYAVTSIGEWAFIRSRITSVIIPNSVVAIGNNAFGSCEGLTSVNIQGNITSIGRYAFTDCSGLVSFDIPNSVTSIGEFAFSGCSGLTSVNIPTGLTSILQRTFQSCSNLKSIIIPTGVTSIGDGAFANCFSLASVAIPNSVVSIGGAAFENCRDLISVNIPNSVTSIGYGVFNFCSSLTDINVEEGNNSYSSDNGVLFNVDKTTLIRYPEGKTDISYSVPEGVVTIDMGAFSGCESLTSVSIANSVTSIGDGAFQYCQDLESVNIGAGLTSLGEDLFSYCFNLNAINVEEGNNSYSSEDGVLFNADKTALLQYPMGKKETAYSVPNGVTVIGQSAFFSCSNLVSVDIPEGVTAIGQSAFSGCSSLMSVDIPKSVTAIATWAFESTGIYENEENWKDDVLYVDDCLIKARTSLTGSLDMAEGTRLIADYAFYNCSGLTTVDIPSSVTNIGRYAFSSCSSLTSIDIPSSVNNTGEYVFYNCSGLKSANINSRTIGDYMFAYCSNLMSVTLGNGVASIGNSAFSGCSGLTSIDIPSSVNNIGVSVFYDCSGLKSANINSRVIGDYMFECCSNLMSAALGDNVVVIGHSAFLDCYSLTSVNIPNSVTTIRPYAFAGTALYNNDMNWTNNVLYVDNCLIQARYGLDDAYEVLNGTRVIADEAFDYVDIVSVDIPGSVQNIGYLAFGNCGDLEVFNVDEKNSCYSSEDGVLFNADKTMLIQYPRAKPATSYSVPESVNTIGDRAFYNCRNLESIIIGSGVTSIGADAFMDCYSLNEMLVKATTPPTIDPYSFHASGIETIYVPAESLDAYKAAEVWNRFNLLPISDSAIGKMEMPENIRISDGFLYNPEGLPICIYDMQGHKVYCGSNTTVSLHNGIYILRCGERSLKVKF